MGSAQRKVRTYNETRSVVAPPIYRTALTTSTNLAKIDPQNSLTRFNICQPVKKCRRVKRVECILFAYFRLGK